MNLLFTSCGRRDYLVRYFQEALRDDDVVHVANSSPFCASFLVPGPKVTTPPIYSPEYIPFLLSYCHEQKIRAIIPLFDVDVPVLAAARAKFESVGTMVIVADAPAARMCNDKWLTFLELRRQSIVVPNTYLTVEAAAQAAADNVLEFPCVVKPRWGMGSVGLMEAQDLAELPYVVGWVKRAAFSGHARYESASDPEHSVVIQERIVGAEYGLDVLNDLEGEYVCTTVRRKLAMRAGETDVAITEDAPPLEALGMRLGKLLRHRGALDVDLFFDGQTATVLELNARFGGGYPFSHLGGANFPAMIVAWLAGKAPLAAWARSRPAVCGLKSLQMNTVTA